MVSRLTLAVARYCGVWMLLIAPMTTRAFYLSRIPQTSITRARTSVTDRVPWTYPTALYLEESSTTSSEPVTTDPTSNVVAAGTAAVDQTSGDAPADGVGDTASSTVSTDPVVRKKQRTRRRTVIDSSPMETPETTDMASPTVETVVVASNSGSTTGNAVDTQMALKPPIVPSPKKVAPLEPQNLVEIPILDIRDLMTSKATTSNQSARESGRRSVPSTSLSSSSSSSAQPKSSEWTPSFESSDTDDPLARLLADAQEMRQAQASTQTEEGSVGIVSKVISTIVTADFFVVMALFVWFLAGIFCSYILKDDTVQIAFNGIFQPIVQPALGILMIAAISDAVLKRKNEGDE